MRMQKPYFAMLARFITLWMFGCWPQMHAAMPDKSSHVDTVFDSHQLLAIIEEQLAALRAGKIDKAYADYTSEEFRKSTSLAQFKKLVNIDVIAKNKSFQPHSFYIENDIATFEGILISKDGSTLQVEYDLYRKGGNGKFMECSLSNLK